MLYIISNLVNKKVFIGETEDDLDLFLEDAIKYAQDGMQDTLSKMIREVGKKTSII